MRQRIEMSVLVVALIVVGIAPGIVVAQVSLEDQLKAQYNMAKMGQDSSGYSVVDAGTLLVVQKGGIVGVPYKNMSVRTSTFQDGTVHGGADVSSIKNSSFLKAGCGLLHKCPSTPDAVNDEATTKLFKSGDKVYATKIAVDNSKDTVTFAIVSCDTCNNVDPPTYNKANVVFKFASGTLAKGDVAKIEDTIGQLFSISNDDQGGQQGGNGNDQQAGNQQGGGGGQGQQQAPPPEPQQIEKGQTPDQVKAALGNPDKIVSLGAKQIYVYKDLKVTFLNGKVSDVQ
jgi:hypothetical protein